MEVIDEEDKYYNDDDRATAADGRSQPSTTTKGNESQDPKGHDNDKYKSSKLPTSTITTKM
eukprot:4046774-Amphidinium_carterae.1